MEADWEFEIGGEAPVIEAYWSGLVDLRARPEQVSELSECGELPTLADALVKLNSPNSPVWTSKTDVFVPEHNDADEMAASADEAVHAITCYVDLLPRGEQMWNAPSEAERYCREICADLRAIELSRCRVDIIVRRAVVARTNDIGMTVYLTACGATPTEANARLGECLGILAEVINSR